MYKETKQERREKKLQSKQSKILQHGRSIVRVYKDAVLKRAKQVRKKKEESP
jgi:hypothetical protein